MFLDEPTSRKIKTGVPPDSTTKDLHALPPRPRPLRRQSASGVFGAGVGKEGNFSRYEGRDIELDPTAPVTAVLTVAYIPPEEGVDGRPGKPRVQSFIVDDSPQNRQRHSSSVLQDIDAVFIECAPPAPAVSALGCSAAAAAAVAGKFSPKAAPSRRSGGGTSAYAGGPGSGGDSGGDSSMEESAKSESIGAIAGVAVPEVHQSGDAGGGGSTTQQKSVGSAEEAKEGADDGVAPDSGGTQPQPQRRSARLSTMANSRAAARSRAASPLVRPQLLPPSASVPLEQADTVLIVGQQPFILANTTSWLELLLPKAVIIGGISGCALVIGDQVRYPPPPSPRELFSGKELAWSNSFRTTPSQKIPCFFLARSL